MRNVAVVFGGRSMENEISVLTGLLVMNVLDGEKYQIVPLYLHTECISKQQTKNRTYKP